MILGLDKDPGWLVLSIYNRALLTTSPGCPMNRVVYCVVTDYGPSEHCDKIGMMIAQHRDGPCHYRDGGGKWPVCIISRGRLRWISTGHVS